MEPKRKQSPILISEGLRLQIDARRSDKDGTIASPSNAGAGQTLTPVTVKVKVVPDKHKNRSKLYPFAAKKTINQKVIQSQKPKHAQKEFKVNDSSRTLLSFGMLIKKEYKSKKRPENKRKFLGSSKSGGCLDPPYDEDVYEYTIQTNVEKYGSESIPGASSENVKEDKKRYPFLDKTSDIAIRDQRPRSQSLLPASQNPIINSDVDESIPGTSINHVTEDKKRYLFLDRTPDISIRDKRPESQSLLPASQNPIINSDVDESIPGTSINHVTEDKKRYLFLERTPDIAIQDKRPESQSLLPASQNSIINSHVNESIPGTSMNHVTEDKKRYLFLDRTPDIAIRDKRPESQSLLPASQNSIINSHVNESIPGTSIKHVTEDKKQYLSLDQTPAIAIRDNRPEGQLLLLATRNQIKHSDDNEKPSMKTSMEYRAKGSKENVNDGINVYYKTQSNADLTQPSTNSYDKTVMPNGTLKYKQSTDKRSSAEKHYAASSNGVVEKINQQVLATSQFEITNRISLSQESSNMEEIIPTKDYTTSQRSIPIKPLLGVEKVQHKTNKKLSEQAFSQRNVDDTVHLIPEAVESEKASNRTSKLDIETEKIDTGHSDRFKKYTDLQTSHFVEETEQEHENLYLRSSNQYMSTFEPSVLSVHVSDKEDIQQYDDLSQNAFRESTLSELEGGHKDEYQALQKKNASSHSVSENNRIDFIDPYVHSTQNNGNNDKSFNSPYIGVDDKIQSDLAETGNVNIIPINVDDTHNLQQHPKFGSFGVNKSNQYKKNKVDSESPSKKKKKSNASVTYPHINSIQTNRNNYESFNSPAIGVDDKFQSDLAEAGNVNIVPINVDDTHNLHQDSKFGSFSSNKSNQHKKNKAESESPSKTNKNNNSVAYPHINSTQTNENNYESFNSPDIGVDDKFKSDLAEAGNVNIVTISFDDTHNLQQDSKFGSFSFNKSNQYEKNKAESESPSKTNKNYNSVTYPHINSTQTNGNNYESFNSPDIGVDDKFQSDLAEAGNVNIVPKNVDDTHNLQQDSKFGSFSFNKSNQYKKNKAESESPSKTNKNNNSVAYPHINSTQTNGNNYESSDFAPNIQVTDSESRFPMKNNKLFEKKTDSYDFDIVSTSEDNVDIGTLFDRVYKTTNDEVSKIKHKSNYSAHVDNGQSTVEVIGGNRQGSIVGKHIDDTILKLPMIAKDPPDSGHRVDQSKNTHELTKINQQPSDVTRNFMLGLKQLEKSIDKLENCIALQRSILNNSSATHNMEPEKQFHKQKPCSTSQENIPIWKTHDDLARGTRHFGECYLFPVDEKTDAFVAFVKSQMNPIDASVIDENVKIAVKRAFSCMHSRKNNNLSSNIPKSTTSEIFKSPICKNGGACYKCGIPTTLKPDQDNQQVIRPACPCRHKLNHPHTSVLQNTPKDSICLKTDQIYQQGTKKLPPTASQDLKINPGPCKATRLGVTVEMYMDGKKTRNKLLAGGKPLQFRSAGNVLTLLISKSENKASRNNNIIISMNLESCVSAMAPSKEVMTL